MNRLMIACFLSFGFAATACAHEGHGRPGEGHTLKHYLLEPIHLPLILLAVAAIVAAGILLTKYVRRRRQISKTLSG